MKVLYPVLVGGRVQISQAKTSSAAISGAQPGKAEARACDATGSPVAVWQERRPLRAYSAFPHAGRQKSSSGHTALAAMFVTCRLSCKDSLVCVI
jgi:hypothetical protein